MINYYGSPIIETERLILRRFQFKDAQNLFDNILSDEHVTDNLIKGAHKNISETIEKLSEIVESYNNKDFCCWGIELKESGELIGDIDFYDFDNSTENCETGYKLGVNWWNKGYATEALKAILEFGFNHMHIHKISAAHNTDNPASGKVMEKAGMKKEGIIKHMIKNSKNQYKDCAVYGLLQEDYLKNISGLQSILRIVDAE